jgi:hypothetical protein
MIFTGITPSFHQTGSQCSLEQQEMDRATVVPTGQLSADDQAILECLEICTAFGWMPSRDHLFRMISLRDDVRNGVRHEDGENVARLRYVRWLVDQGLISES